MVRRCDNDTCRFHTEPLLWNGRPLPVILDHKGGARRNNRPEALQYLCPNCNAQEERQGGHDKGRIVYDEQGSGYTRYRRRGSVERDIRMMAETAHFGEALGRQLIKADHRPPPGRRERGLKDGDMARTEKRLARCSQ